MNTDGNNVEEKNPAEANRSGQEGDSLDGDHPEPSEAESAEGQKTSPIDDLHRELEEAREKHLRLRAEFENFRKRSAREQSQIRDRASEHVIKDLLPAIDDLERASDSIPTDGENAGALAAFKEGIELVLKSLREKLENHDLSVVEALGEPFDPERHEAVMAVESEEHPGDTVIEEVQKGYSIGDKVIRPSRVVVAKAITKEEDA